MIAIAGVLDALLAVTGVLIRNGTITPADMVHDAEMWAKDRQEKGAFPQIIATLLELRTLALTIEQQQREYQEREAERGQGVPSPRPTLTVIPGGKPE